jgi:hypothetical protein
VLQASRGLAPASHCSPGSDRDGFLVALLEQVARAARIDLMPGPMVEAIAIEKM